jgi:sarcosine oxidase gamma subunit
VLEISAGGFDFVARLEEETAPATVAAFRRLLPLESRIIHVRWSGEAGWIVLYPGGVSETEILLAYGYVSFASKAGALAGNHFATIVEGGDNLRELGRRFLWEGAQEIVFRER